MFGIFTTSRSPECCDGCGNAIPVGNVYVLTWVGRADDKRYWHLDCHPADLRVMRLIGGVRD